MFVLQKQDQLIKSTKMKLIYIKPKLTDDEIKNCLFY